MVLWIYTLLVLLMCPWTSYFRLFFNFNIGQILEEHGCSIWFSVNWSIRVDPCSKSIYIYIYFIIFLHIISTNITISILNFPLTCCATRTTCGHAWMAHHSVELGASKSTLTCCATWSHCCRALVAQRSVELGASKSTCCCPLIPHPTYLLIYIFLLLYIYILCSVLLSQSFLNIVQCDTTNNSWWSIRVDPFFNWTIRVVPYLFVS
jgi:hypothetical protein